MFSSVSSALLWRGLLAVALGIVSVAWPNITVGPFVILFAIYAFLAAGSDAARALSSDRAGPVAGYLFLPCCHSLAFPRWSCRRKPATSAPSPDDWPTRQRNTRCSGWLPTLREPAGAC
jgi:hypothetical protein